MFLHLSVSHPPGRHPREDTTPQQTATAADSTHPTGMHSFVHYETSLETRMHSSRMRTGHLLTICRSLLPGGGGVYLVPGGVLSPGGCT